MWWECSECGGHLDRERPPVVCRICGTAGAVFARVSTAEAFGGVTDDDDLRAAWFSAGLERGHAITTQR